MNDSTQTRLNAKKLLAVRLSGYAAAAGTLVALTPDASAQVEYSGEIDTLLFHSSGYFYVDLNNDGTDEVRFGGNFTLLLQIGLTTPFGHIRIHIG